MSIEAAEQIPSEQAPTGASVWLALAAPIIWSLDLGIRYALVPMACGRHGDVTWLRVISFTCVGLVTAGAIVCLLEWRGTASRDNPGGVSAVPARARFTALLGLMSCVLFVILLIAGALPTYFIDPCVA
jgi:hypothetical protein